ncbi:hypothetical protein TNCV_3007001 [Trichonephila clavipes]|nr:hypothetical protein TNCV_3007001 [Trichonephila clavipes]
MIDGGKTFRLRSNKVQYSSKNGSGERRELQEKGTGLRKDQDERHTIIASNGRPLVRSSPGSLSEPNRRTKSVERKHSHTKDHYKLILEEEEDNKEDQFNPEETENNSTAPTLRSKEGQVAGVLEAERCHQQHCQEKTGGVNSRRSQSLEVLVGDVNYKT